MTTRKSPWRPERRRGLFALALAGAALLLASPAPAAPPAPAATATPATPRIPREGLRKLADISARIERNAREIERISHIFPAPGYPREDIRRAMLVRANQDLLREAGSEAGRLLDPVRRDPPPGEWAAWQLLRDVETDTQRARLMGSWDFTDATIPRRLAAMFPADNKKH